MDICIADMLSYHQLHGQSLLACDQGSMSTERQIAHRDGNQKKITTFSGTNVLQLPVNQTDGRPHDDL